MNGFLSLIIKTTSNQPHKFESKDAADYIQNAGLVLVHPFLSGDNEYGFSLFQEANLMKEGKFIDDKSQETSPAYTSIFGFGERKRTRTPNGG